MIFLQHSRSVAAVTTTFHFLSPWMRHQPCQDGEAFSGSSIDHLLQQLMGGVDGLHSFGAAATIGMM